MKNISVRLIIKIISSIIYKVGLLLSVVLMGLILFFFIKNPYWLAIDSCMDSGKVWDGHENRCREDCFTWNEAKGCIQLTRDETEAFRKCRHQPVSCHNILYDKIFPKKCFDYAGAWNLDTKNCNYEFNPEDCFKLQGNWQYPKICNKK